MSVVAIDWNPTDRHVRQFAVAALVALPALSWIWSGGNLTVVAALAACGSLLGLVGWLSPRTIRPVFLALTLLMLPLGIVIGELVLLIVYFGVFLPIGLTFRLVGRDSMTRALERNARTYWSDKAQPRGRGSYFQQW